MDIILKMIWYLSDSFFLDKIKEFLSISNAPMDYLHRCIYFAFSPGTGWDDDAYFVFPSGDVNLNNFVTISYGHKNTGVKS